MTDFETWLAEQREVENKRHDPDWGYLRCLRNRCANFPKALRMLEMTVGELGKWFEYVKNYDPYGPNSVGRYGSGAAGIEKAGVEKKLEEILDIVNQIAKEG